jgi:hypothetical protein
LNSEGIVQMSKVLSAHAVSVDGYITGRDPGPGRGLGDGTMLFDWVHRRRHTEPGVRRVPAERAQRPVFDTLAARVGATVAGRNTYEDSERFGGGSPHPTARLVVLSHRPAP